MFSAMLLTLVGGDLDQSSGGVSFSAGSFLSHVDPAFGVFFFLSIGAIALFTFLSVAKWSDARKAERESYYKAEMMKKIAEAGGSTNPALDFLREQERILASRRLGGFKAGGLVVSGLGLGVMIFLKALIPEQPIYLCGTIFLFTGLALLAYALWFAPERDAARHAG